MEKPTKPELCFCCPTEQKAEVSSAYILLHANSSRWVLVNETFRHIASLLDKGISADEVAASISAQFSIPLQSARRDVDYAVDTLTEQGFLSSLSQDVPLRVPSLSDLFIHVTDRCNLSCPHCYYPSASFGDMAPGLVRRMIDEEVELGGKTITFSGGEPLLHPISKHCFSMRPGNWAFGFSPTAPCSIGNGLTSLPVLAMFGCRSVSMVLVRRSMTLSGGAGLLARSSKQLTISGKQDLGRRSIFQLR